jgi:outer membrane murein-binding lipoprotein Lpp
MLTLALKALLAVTPAGVLLSLLLTGILNPMGFMLACLGAAVTGVLLLVLGLYQAQEEMDRQLASCIKAEFDLRYRVAMLEQEVERLREAEAM